MKRRYPLNNSTSFHYAITYSGCFLGAGFVAGNEMRDFFGKFDIYGFLLFGVSLFICAFTTYRITLLKNAYSDKNFETVLFGTNKKSLSVAFSFAKHLFMLGLIIFCTSCAGEILHLISGLNSQYGALLLIIITLVISLNGKDGVLTIFSVCVPIVSIFCLLYTVNFTVFEEKVFLSVQNPIPGGLYLPLLYAGYNIFAGVGEFAPYCSKQTTKKGLFWGSTILFICGSSVMWLTLISPTKSSMPILDIIYSHNRILGVVFSVLLFLSLISTAASRTFMLVDTYSQNQSYKKHICFIVCICAYILSFIGFNKIIKLIYPIFGIIGTISIIIINLKYKIKFSSVNTKQFCVFFHR